MNSKKSNIDTEWVIKIANSSFEEFIKPEGVIGSPRLCYIHGYVNGYIQSLKDLRQSLLDKGNDVI